MGRALNEWFDSHAVRPKVVSEMDDAGLATVLGEAGLGVFAAPDLAEKEIRRCYDVEPVGRARELSQHLYAIFVERKIRHPGVIAICGAARRQLTA